MKYWELSIRSGQLMKDVNGKEIDVCGGETRKAPGMLRREAERLRRRASMLDELADQTDGTLSTDADTMLYVLLRDSSE